MLSILGAMKMLLEGGEGAIANRASVVPFGAQP